MPFASSSVPDTTPSLALLRWPSANSYVPATEIDVASITYSQSSVYSSNTAATNATMTNGSAAETSATATNNSAGEFIRMDFGAVVPVARVFIGTASSALAGGWGDNAIWTNNTELQYTTDGTNWTTERTITGLTAATIHTLTVSFSASAIRIIRPVLTDYIVVTEFYALST